MERERKLRGLFDGEDTKDFPVFFAAPVE